MPASFGSSKRFKDNESPSIVLPRWPCWAGPSYTPIRHVADVMSRDNQAAYNQSESPMNPPLDPLCAEVAPAEPLLTPYDHEHAVTYLRMLDAHSEGADWRDVSRIVLHTDPERDAHRARRAYESHLARAKWMTSEGYRQLLRSGWPSDR